MSHGSASLQVLPYFYVPYGDDLPGEAAAAQSWLRDLARGVEVALSMGAPVRSLRRSHCCLNTQSFRCKAHIP